MPREHTIKLFKYAELSADAQSKARDWWRDAEARSCDTFFAESATDDFKEILPACGITLDGSMFASTSKVALYWSGFAHQGAGACFAGTWYAAKVQPAAIAAMIADRPKTYTDADGKQQTCKINCKLLPLLERALELRELYPDGSATLTANNRYMSTRCESANVSDESDREDDAELCDAVEDFARDLAAYFYFVLETEYDYLMSDEQVAETLTVNEFEFTADGDFYS